MKRVILLLETSRGFGRDLLYGISRYSKLNSSWSFFNEPRGLKSSIPRLKKWDADGIIMRNSIIKNDLLELNLPTILALHDSNRPNNVPAICTDSKSISSIAAEHLFEKGLKNYGFCGYDNTEWSDGRKFYFKKKVEDAGFNLFIYSQSVELKRKSWYHEQNKLKKWLMEIPKPIGIMACNDDRGQQILEICKSLDIKVPEEVSVVGVDDDKLICDLADPPLSSVKLNTEHAGYAAGKLIDRMMNESNEYYDDIIVSGTHVVKRQSTDLIAVEDNEVKSAIKYIRDNARNKISVKDIVSQTCLGRKSLERRFKKLLKRTIYQEVRRVRTELVKDLLMDTNLTIAEITELFDFTGSEHISRYFYQELGMSLMQFRKMNQINKIAR